MALKIIYFGEVQGVGFRYNALRCADGLNLKGYVKNLADGSVELVVAGTAEHTATLLNKIDATMRGHINNKVTSHFNAQDLEDFKIERNSAK